MRLRLAACGLALLLGAGCAEMPVGRMEVVPVAKAPAEEPPQVQPQAPAHAATPDATAAPIAAEPAPKPAVVAVVSPPPPPPTLWGRIRGGFQMPNLEGPLVQDWEKWYSS